MKKCTFFLIMALAIWHVSLAQKDTICNEESIQVLSYELPSSSLTMTERMQKGQVKIITEDKKMSLYIPCIQNKVEMPFGGDVSTLSITGNLLTIEGQGKAFNRPFIVIFRLTAKEKIRFEEFYQKTK